MKNRTLTIQPNRLLAATVLGSIASSALVLRTPSAEGYASFTSFCREIMDTVGAINPIAMSTLMIVLTALCYRAFHVGISQDMQSRAAWIICAMILTLSIIVPGSDIEGYQTTGFPWYSSPRIPHSWLYVIVFLIRWVSLSAILVCGLICAHDTWRNCNLRDTRISIVKRLFQFHWKNMAVLTGGIYCCWIPWLIILGPASLNIDTMVQLIQYRGIAVWDPMTMTMLPQYRMTDHHPFFDTYLYGFFDRIGLALGNEIIGFVILTQLQALFAACVLSLALVWVKSRTSLPDCIILALTVGIAFIPAFPMTMSTILKDSTWAPIFLLWMILFFEVAYRAKHGTYVSWQIVAAVIVVALLAALTKKTSIYITTPATLLLFFFVKNKAKIATAALVPALISLIIIPQALFPILNIAPGGPQEAIAVPMQQVAKVVIDHRQDLSDKDLTTIDRVMKLDKIASNFNYVTTDNIKSATYRVDSTKSDRTQFMLLWAKLLLKYPVDYVRAVPYLRSAYVLRDTYYQTDPVKNGWDEIGGKYILPQYQGGQSSFIQEHVGNHMKEIVRRIPPFSLLGAEALYTLWIPLTSFTLVATRRNWKYMAYFLPTLFLEATQFIIPAHQTRYSLGLFFCATLIIAIPFLKIADTTGNKTSTCSPKDGR